ncbi:MAG: hypothetical protein DCC49_13705 [Acidobacteria bacterium]|nr:MAG: hypothetical protein DCC49_13705 [Acidobacteriota bacterium]
MERVELGGPYLPRGLRIDNYWGDMSSDMNFGNPTGRGGSARQLGEKVYGLLDNFPFKTASVIQLAILAGTFVGNAAGQASVW